MHALQQMTVHATKHHDLQLHWVNMLVTTAHNELI